MNKKNLMFLGLVLLIIILIIFNFRILSLGNKFVFHCVSIYNETSQCFCESPNKINSLPSFLINKSNTFSNDSMG